MILDKSMKSYERVIELLSIALLITAGVFGVFVAILDFIGTDFENGPWKWLKGPLPTILLTVALLSLAVGLERFIRFHQIARRLDKIERLVSEGPQNIIRALDGVEVHHFADTKELYEYVAKRMQKAKRTIDDLTWGPAERGTTQAAEQAAEKYVKTISMVCSKKDMAYREIMSFSLLLNC
jgi:hypothetical protein